MADVTRVMDQQAIPELNEYQCGTYVMHSLDEAKAIAETVLSRGIGINHNDDLNLSDEKLAGL